MDMFAEMEHNFKRNPTHHDPSVVPAAEMGVMGGSPSGGKEPVVDGNVQARLDKLESMLSQLLVKDSQARNQVDLLQSPFSSDSEDEVYRESASTRKSKSRRRFRQAKFLEEGEAVNSFETVMLVGLRTIQSLVDEGKDPKPLYKHLEFMAKKASMCRYKFEAFVGYDSRVHERAGALGVDVFAEMSSEDVATFFCAENMLYLGNKTAKKTNDMFRKKSGRICLAFNKSSCSFKSCNYSHCCLACEDQGHGRKDCPVLKQRKSAQK